MRQLARRYGQMLPLVVLAVAATALIIHYYLIFEEAGKITAYGDGIARLNNGRRIWDNPLGQFSIAQAGSIWLVGKSLLISLTAWYDPMYRSGLSGSIWSMASFVITVPLVYETVRTVTRQFGTLPSNIGGIAAALVLGLNTNLIYFGTTPMTEPEVILAEAACCLALVKFEQDPTSWKKLWFAAMALALSGWIRYELWFFAGVALPLMGIAMWAKGMRGYEFFATMLMPFMLLGGTVATWLVFWQWQLFDDPLYFSHSDYSARAIDVIGAHKTFAVHDLRESVRQYAEAVRLNFPIELLGAAGAGIVLYILQHLGRRSGATSLLFLLGIPVFFITSLYLGQNAIDIRHDGTASFNIRYGLTVIPLVAIGVGYLVANLARFHAPLLDWSGKVLAVAGLAFVYYIYAPSLNDPTSTAVLHDVSAQQSPAIKEIAGFLKTKYDGDLILAESFGSTNAIQFYSGIPFKYYVTESVPEAFQKAIANPIGNVDWIIIRNGDSISRMLSEPKFRDNYRVVFSNAYGKVLVINDRVDLAATQ